MKTKIILTALLVLSLSATAFATPPKIDSASNIDWGKAELNYKAALVSENAGVRSSATNFIAQYRLTGAVSDLAEVLRHDKKEQVRMAAALALIQIGKEEGRKAVEEAVLYDGSQKVSSFCEQLLKASSSDLSIR
jgi:HEAT repeat protein